MQEENAISSDFLDRTDRLAKKLGLQINALPEALGCSRSTLFLWRKDPEKVTRSAWKKLAAAESKAGLAERASPRESYRTSIPRPRSQRVSGPDMFDDFDQAAKMEGEKPCIIPELTAEDRLARLEFLVMDLQKVLINLQSALIRESEKSD